LKGWYIVDNPYLTLSKAMGLEFNENTGKFWCYDEHALPLYLKPDTWQFFGLVWDWSQDQEWWKSFLYQNGTVLSWQTQIETDFIHPTRFPEKVEEFLKERA